MAVTPKSYRDKVVPLGDDQFPYGSDCPFSRDIQAAAFHHGLSVANLDSLDELQFDTALSFSTANPDGDEEQQGVFRLTIAVFDSPVARSKVSLFIRRLCRDDIFAAMDPPSSSKSSSVGLVPKKQKAAGHVSDVGVGVASKKQRVGDHVLGVNVGASTSADPDSVVSGDSAAAGGQESASAAGGGERTPSKCVSFSSSDDGSDDSDSDSLDEEEQGGESGVKKERTKKTDRVPKDAHSMVEELGSAVSFGVT